MPQVLAAEFGHLDCLKYLHETAKAPWNSEALWKARKNKHDDDDDFDRDAERRRCRRRGGRREDAMVVVLPLVATRIFTSSINRVSLCVRFGFRSREREREVLSRVKVVTTKRIASKGLLLCSR